MLPIYREWGNATRMAPNHAFRPHPARFGGAALAGPKPIRYKTDLIDRIGALRASQEVERTGL